MESAVVVVLGWRFSSLTAQDVFETWFSAQNRGERPWLEPVHTADCHSSRPVAASFNTPIITKEKESTIQRFLPRL